MNRDRWQQATVDHLALWLLSNARYYYIVPCPLCRGRGCHSCRGRGFHLKLWKPSHWPDEAWQPVARIPRDRVDAWMFEEGDLDTILKYAESLNANREEDRL